MIEAVVGYPGNGKTFYCTNRAYKAMKRGQKVFTNYPVRGAYRVSFDDLINYTFPQNSMVIIDESGRWFNSRKWTSLPDEVFDLFTLHRHMKLDLLVAVQNFNRIDKALREVIELVWWARNILGFPFFIYEGYYDVEQVGLKGEFQKKSFVSKLSRSRKLYDTHIMANEVNKDDIPEVPWTNAEDRPSIMSRFLSIWKTRQVNTGEDLEEEEPADLGECLACEVGADRAADSLDSEVKDDVK